jgi:uncharacterized protein (DUF433 family)
MPPQETEIAICAIPPQGMLAPRQVGYIADFGEQEEARMDSNWWLPHILDTSFMVGRRLRWLAARQRYVGLWGMSHEEEIRAYNVPVLEAFHEAARSYPQVSIDPDVMAGAPCIKGTRIPVYMILDAMEYYGSIEGAIKSYPYLTSNQVKEAIGFSKLVVECPFEDKSTSLAR